MSPEVSERAFETAIEQALLSGGPDTVDRGMMVAEASVPYGLQFSSAQPAG